MPEKKPVAFLACSFETPDREVVNFFAKLISATGFEVDVEFVKDRKVKVTDRVRNRLKVSDCLIGLICNRKDNTSVYEEIAIASDQGKKTLLFVEEQVERRGMFSEECINVQFSREPARLPDAVPEIVEHLLALHRELRSTVPDAGLPHQSLRRDLVEIKEQFTAEQVVTTIEVEMECMSEKLPYVQHYHVVEDRTPSLSIKPIKFEFEHIEAPEGVKCNVRNVSETDRRQTFRIEFTPELTWNQRLKYRYRTAIPRDIPLWREEAEARLRDGTYHLADPLVRICEWAITYETMELHYQAEFPEKYEVGDPKLEVIIDEPGIPAVSEIERLQNLKALTVKSEFQRPIVRLKVQSPKFGYVYAILFTPPNRPTP